MKIRVQQPPTTMKIRRAYPLTRPDPSTDGLTQIQHMLVGEVCYHAKFSENRILITLTKMAIDHGQRMAFIHWFDRAYPKVVQGDLVVSPEYRVQPRSV